jgi:hypothetical protein
MVIEDMIMNKKLEARISKLEKLLMKESNIKNESGYLEIADDADARVPFDKLLLAVRQAWAQLHPLLKEAKQCDQLLGGPGSGDSIYTILKGICNDLQTLSYSTNVDYYADDEREDESEYYED